MHTVQDLLAAELILLPDGSALAVPAGGDRRLAALRAAVAAIDPEDNYLAPPTFSLDSTAELLEILDQLAPAWVSDPEDREPAMVSYRVDREYQYLLVRQGVRGLDADQVEALEVLRSMPDRERTELMDRQVQVFCGGEAKSANLAEACFPELLYTMLERGSEHLALWSLGLNVDHHDSDHGQGSSRGQFEAGPRATTLVTQAP